MDLGSLELQIFVSLTVVLGGAFVALVCDYLKGNNEQLREHNIELRVRKEEQERRLLLDPAGFIGQWLPGSKAANGAAAPAAAHSTARTVGAHEVMHSFADPDALQEVESRAARFSSRGGGEPYESAADVPPLTPRRNGRNRSNRKGARDGRSNGESYADWVRPEVIARVARKSEAAMAYASDIRDDLEAAREKESARSEPLNSAGNWDIRDQLPVKEKPARTQPESVPALPQAAEPVPAAIPVEARTEIEKEIETVAAEPSLNAVDASRLQKEIERVAQLEQTPVAPAPGTILRPLTVPSLTLREEIQRVAEAPQVSVQVSVPVPVPAVWHSPLLDEVIAASGSRARERMVVPEPEIAEVHEEEQQTIVAEQPDVETDVAPVVEAAVSASLIMIEQEEIDADEPVLAAADELSDAAELPSFPLASEEEIVAVGGEPPIVVEEVAETVELPLFVFATEEEVVAVASEPPVAVEEVAEAVELPSFVFAAEEEIVAVASEPPVTVGEVAEAVELPPFVFAAEEEIVVVAAEPAVAFEEVAEAVEQPSFVFATEEEVVAVASEPAVAVEIVAEAVEQPSFVFVAEEEVVAVASEPPVVVEKVAEAVELPPFVFAAEEEVVAVASEPRVAVEEVAEAVELPSFAFEIADLPVLVRAVEPIAVEDVAAPEVVTAIDEVAAHLAVLNPEENAETLAETPNVEVVSLVEAPPFVLALDEPAAELIPEPSAIELLDQELEPQPFAYLMSLDPELNESSSSHRIDIPELPAFTETNEAEVIAMAGFDEYESGPRLSALSGMGVTPFAEYLPVLPAIEKPFPSLSLSEEPALTALPEPEEATESEPPPFWNDAPLPVAETVSPATPIDISVARPAEPVPVEEAPAGHFPDLLLPTGMHDLSTWTRLLTLPNPMTGILFIINLQPSEPPPAPDRKGAAAPPPDNGPAIEKLMASFVREGDFGTRIAEYEWVFIYNHDVAGFNQRRVGMISEKLWDFQLRHLGMSDVRFKWGAVDVQSEKLSAALQAARDRMNQTRRVRKLPGADQAASRRVANA